MQTKYTLCLTVYRHVDIAKRDLLEFIQNRTTYFEERGSYIYQKWELLRQLI